MWQEIKKIINQKHFFLLTTHVNPDGDGIGAACAMTELLSILGKKVKFVCDSSIPRKFDFLNYQGNYEIYDSLKDYSDIQVVFILDTHNKERIGRVYEITNNPSVITICIDHHPLTDPFATINIIQSKACSTGALVYHLYREMGICFNLNAATGIYTSIICDTGRFSTSSTNRKAHKIAEECIKLGVDPQEMYTRLFQHVSLAEIKMFAHTLQRMETHLENKVIVQQIYREDCEKIGEDLAHVDLDYILEFNKWIVDVECVVLLRELADNKVRVSLRSRFDLGIGKLMQALGGGGHSKAAGVCLRGSLQEVKKLILDCLETLFYHQTSHMQICNKVSLLDQDIGR